jgi:hypothetical protein
MIQSLPRAAGCYARCRMASRSSRRNCVVVASEYHWDGPGQEGAIARRSAHDPWMNSAQLRTHTAHYSPVTIAPLSINSSHADCRPERSFFLSRQAEHRRNVELLCHLLQQPWSCRKNSHYAAPPASAGHANGRTSNETLSDTPERNPLHYVRTPTIRLTAGLFHARLQRYELPASVA